MKTEDEVPTISKKESDATTADQQLGCRTRSRPPLVSIEPLTIIIISYTAHRFDPRTYPRCITGQVFFVRNTGVPSKLIRSVSMGFWHSHSVRAITRLLK